MARTKTELGAGARLSDYLSVSLLARVYPPQRVHDVLDCHGVNSQRVRDFPASAVTYFCMGLSLYPEASTETVFAIMAQGLGWMQGGAAVPTVATSSISVARAKVGFAPLQSLYERCCVPLADPLKQPYAFFGGLRLVAIDGTNFELADEPANSAESVSPDIFSHDPWGAVWIAGAASTTRGPSDASQPTP